MKLADAVDAIARTAMLAKEGAISQDKASFVPKVVCWRGEDMVASVGLLAENDRLVDLVALCGSGFSADVMVLVYDTLRTAPGLDRNPMTGTVWRPGDAQDLFDDHDGVERGWVEEGLVVVAANRAEDVVTSLLPYAVEGSRVRWGERVDSATPRGEAAEFTRLLLDVMAMPSIHAIAGHAGAAGDQIGAAVSQLDGETMLAIGDVAAVQRIHDEKLGLAALIFREGSKRHELLLQLGVGG